jgi:hypothetical protein
VTLNGDSEGIMSAGERVGSGNNSIALVVIPTLEQAFRRSV